jgi:hypothetical protein
MESVADLEKWLAGNHTHPEISFWVPRYLKARARTTFCDLINYAPQSACISMSSQMKALALSQDIIGWTHMLEGKISGHFRAIQARHLRQRNARINGQDWVNSCLLHVYSKSRTLNGFSATSPCMIGILDILHNFDVKNLHQSWNTFIPLIQMTCPRKVSFY